MAQIKKRLTLREKLEICEQEKERLNFQLKRLQEIPKRNVVLFCFIAVFFVFSDLYGTGMASRQQSLIEFGSCKHNMEDLSLAEEAYFSDYHTYTTRTGDLKKYIVNFYGAKRARSKLRCPGSGRPYVIGSITAKISEGYQVSCETAGHSWTYDTGVVLRDY